MGVPYEKIVLEDLNLGTGVVDVTMPGGGTAKGHRLNAESFGPSGLIFPLGGSLLTELRDSAQVDVIDPVEIELPAIDLTAFILEVFVTCRTSDGATTVQPALYDVTNSQTLGAGVASSAISDEFQKFTINGEDLPTSGIRLKLQVLPSNATNGVFCNGYARLRINAGSAVVFSVTPAPSTAPSSVTLPLGGSLVLGLKQTGRGDVIDPMTVVLPSGDLSAYTLEVVVTCRTEGGGTSLQPVLRDVTHGADLASGSSVAPTSNATQRFTVPGSSLPTNGPNLRLQVITTNNTNYVYANGYARLYTS